jgi:hypothetical protein
MGRKRFSPEKIIGKVVEGEVALSAEAVEKGIPRGYFLPIFVPFGPPKIIYNQL